MLETMFLMRRIPPYFHNRLKRLIKTPKVQFLDSGVLARLAGATAERINDDRRFFGPVLQTFVYSELLKHSSVSDEEYSLLHYRDRDQVEVDFVIERNDGAIVAVEVKAAATAPLGDDLYAMPVAEVRRNGSDAQLVDYPSEPFSFKGIAKERPRYQSGALILATRNTKDFEGFGIPLFNPFDHQAP